MNSAIKILGISEISENNPPPHIYAEILINDNKWKKILFPYSLALYKNKLREFLLVNGMELETIDREINNIVNSLSLHPSKTFFLATQPGHLNQTYITRSGEVIGSFGEIPPQVWSDVFRSPEKSLSGSLEDWKKNVAFYSSHSSRLMLSICNSFSAYLLRFTSIESGGFHLYGQSSTGKSTSLRVASTISYGYETINSWNSTLTGLEEKAIENNDNTIILDELASIDPDPRTSAKIASNAIYALSEGKVKGRSKYYSTSKYSWRTTIISAGELSLSRTAIRGGKPQMLGEKVRVIDVPADAGEGMGIYESLPDGFECPAKLSDHISKNCRLYFGTAELSFLNKLMKKINKSEETFLDQLIDRKMNVFLREIDVGNLTGYEKRSANRFALAYAAGCIAIMMKVLPCQKKKLLESILKVYKDYMSSSRDGGQASSELKRARKALYNTIKLKSNLDLRAFHNSKNESLSDMFSFMHTFKAQQVYAIPNNKFNELFSDNRVRKIIISDLRKRNIIMLGADDKSTVPITNRTNLPNIGRCFLVKEDMLSHICPKSRSKNPRRK